MERFDIPTHYCYLQNDSVLHIGKWQIIQLLLKCPSNQVFLLLVIEMASFLFLVMPLPRTLRRQVIQLVSQTYLASKIALCLRFTFAFILILFVDSVNRVYRVQYELNEFRDSRSMSMERSEIQARKFYAQRNMYLCGFTLFLSLILNRTYHLVVDLMAAHEKIDGLSSSSDASVKSSALSAEKDSQITQLKNELKRKDTDLATLKKQCEHLTQEYHQMSDKVNAGQPAADKKND